MITLKSLINEIALVQKAIWIKTNGDIKEVEPDNGTDFTLEECYKYTNGGPVQLINLDDDDRIMLINEEGKMRNLPINRKATQLYNNPHDFVVGDVLICHPDQFR